MSYLEMYMWIFGYFGNGLLLLWLLIWGRHNMLTKAKRQAAITRAVNRIRGPKKVFLNIWGDGEGRGVRGIR